MSEPISLEEQQELAAGYAMDDLSVEEAEFFEQLLQETPYLRQNVRLMRETFGAIPANLTLTAPPASLKGKIFAEIATESAVATMAKTKEAESRSEQNRVEPLKSRSQSPWRRIIAVLAALGAIALIVDNFRLRSALQFSQQEQQKSAETIAQLQRNSQATATIMERGNSRLVSLTGEDNNTDASKGSLMFTPGKWEKVVLSLQNLPPLDSDEVYRLWLTLENGTTIACGQFNTNTDKKIFVELNPPQLPPKGVKATGIFVTIDRKDAPLTPKGEPVLSGKITKLS
jgi:anti-sigma-K factor RskA